ncbi:MAG: carbamoyltransferase HypF [Pseudomonadota bacterium]
MCLAVPSEVVELRGEDSALVSVNGVRQEVSLALVEDVGVGDWLIVHAGFAIHRMDEESARESLAFLQEAARAMDFGGELRALEIRVAGVVQGVGFRPFVLRLARELSLSGHVANSPAGVAIRAEGPPEALEAFTRRLSSDAPALALVREVEARPGPPGGLSGFHILESGGPGEKSALVPPDVCACEACLAEMRDPANRRFRYPFINCTDCGPRYTLVDGVPYDRPRTSMRAFAMCPACQAEYQDPGNRRFHAQPNACPDCGPTAALLDSGGGRVECPDPVREAAGLLANGEIVAIRGLGGFHLACDAENAGAVARLRERKGRWEKPLAIMSPDLAAISRYARVSPQEAELLTSPARPIVLLEKRHPFPLAPDVAPGLDLVGAMLPYTPLHALVLDHGFTALVMTSGNRSSEPVCMGVPEALKRLSGIADFFLVHDREILQRNDDSVARVTAGRARVIRRSRGYVPGPVYLPREVPPILAAGGHLKNVLAVASGDRAILSQHVGDLENPLAVEFLRETAGWLTRLSGIEPEIVAHDLHPDYASTAWARREFGNRPGPRLSEVQHHHAHAASCMAEHGLAGPVIAIVLDGAGYGPDGTVWGGEVLVADYSGFSRAAHLETVPMPGGDAAAAEPWRMAVSHLFRAMGPEALDLPLAPVQEAGDRMPLLVQAMEQGINAPLTSSMGRLFDAVASICGIRQVSSFEGQAAMELEAAARGEADRLYPYSRGPGEPRILGTSALVRAVVRDVLAGEPAAAVSARFHATLVRLLAEIAREIARETGLTRVVLSGGVFQNARLLSGLLRELSALGLTPFAHEKVPANDGGLALGQVMVAAARARGAA